MEELRILKLVSKHPSKTEFITHFALGSSVRAVPWGATAKQPTRTHVVRMLLQRHWDRGSDLIDVRITWHIGLKNVCVCELCFQAPVDINLTFIIYDKFE